MDIDAPEPRKLGEETRDTLQAQVDLAPAVYESEAKFRPKYAALERQLAWEGVVGTDEAPGLMALLKEIQPDLDELSGNMQDSQRERDVSAVERLGPRAIAALKAANPDQARLIDRLNADVMADLESGGALSDSETREYQQAMRGAQGARGFGYGQNDVFMEAMGLGQLGEARKQRRRGSAMQMVGLNQATSSDPFLAILGRPSQQPNALQSIAGQGYGLAGQGPQLFDPMHPYAQDLYNTNYNAKAAAQIAEGNATAGLYGAAIEAVGNIAGGALGCWVAREVYGEMDPRWMVFRGWLMAWAPAWFRGLYMKHGERVAGWLKNRPLAKRAVRWAMDLVVVPRMARMGADGGGEGEGSRRGAEGAEGGKAGMGGMVYGV